MLATGSQLAAGLMAVAALLGGVSAARADATQPAKKAAQAGAADAAAPMRFDIPRLPLAAALSRFHAVTGLSLLYEDATLEGRSSRALHGEHTPEVALRELLADSAIVAHYTSRSAFMLMRPQVPASAEASGFIAEGEGASAGAARAARRDYYAQLQARVTAALCAEAVTVPGSYRLALNLWIDAQAPTVERVALHSTGNERRDARIAARLTGLSLESAPPDGVVQPITLLILPRQPAQTGDCRFASGEVLRP